MLRDSRGQTLYPALKGRLWLDRQSGRLLRLQLQTTRLPPRSEFRTVSITIDYEEIPIANAGTFLLPSKSKADVCMSAPYQYGMSCTSNALEFHDCQKFVVKSHIVTGGPER